MLLAILLSPLQAQGAPTQKVEPLYFNLVSKSGKIGTATYEPINLPEDGHEVKITLDLGSNITVIVDGKYDSKNVWTVKTMDATIQSRSAHFEAKMVTNGAQVQVPGPNGLQTKVLEPPADLSLADPSITWWKGVTPTTGETHTFAYFDLQKQVWEKEVVTYVDDETQQVNGTSFSVHKVTQKIDDNPAQVEYLDSKGNPVIIEGDPRFERLPGKPAQ